MSLQVQQLSRVSSTIHNMNKLLSIGNRCPKPVACRYSSVEVATQDKMNNAEQVAPIKEYVSALRSPDFFQVNNLFTVKDLFDARVHFGHREDTLNDNMRQYIFGSRMSHLIFDLPTTAEHLRRALNFAAHIAYRDGIILFACQYHQHCSLVEQTAIDCGEFAFTREFRRGLLTNSLRMFRSTIRLPDLIIFLNTLNSVLETHQLVYESAKMNIPSIGIVDSNSDPTIITYPVPGNDDSASSVELYCKLFKTAILKGKEVRKKEYELYNVSNQ